MAKIVANTEAGAVAKPIEQCQNRGNEGALFASTSKPSRPHGCKPSAIAAARPAVSSINTLRIPRSKARARAAISPAFVVRRQHVRDACGGLNGDEIREAQSAKTMVGKRETFKLGPDGRRREDAPEKLRQQPLLAQPGEVQDDRRIRDDNHSCAIFFHAAKS
jgi:hypothetical protein